MTQEYYEFQRMVKIGRIIEIFKNFEGEEFTRKQVSNLLEHKDLTLKWIGNEGYRPVGKNISLSLRW